MTDVSAQQHLRLPVDASSPPERLGRPLLLAVGIVVLVLHLGLVVVFTPLAPEPVEAGNRAGHSASFMSSGVTAASPDFMKTVDTYDPIAFLHPPEDVGFSFFRSTRDDFSLDAPSEPVLPQQKLDELKPLPPLEPDSVVRLLVRDVPETYPDPDMEAAAVPVAAYPYCVVDSRPDVTLPAIPLNTQTERILRRSPPSRPSVFELRKITNVVLPAGDPGLGSPDPLYEAILTRSCGDVELDLVARAWLDTFLNSQDARMLPLRYGDRFRVVWSAKALGKEPSER